MMSRWTKRNVSLALAVVVLLGAVAFFATQFPSVDQTPNQVIQVPGDFETIAEAVKHAQSGQTIEVDALAGPYEESFIISQNDVSLVSVNGQAEIVFPEQNRLGLVLEGDNNILEGFFIHGRQDQWLQVIGNNSLIDHNKIHHVRVLFSGEDNHITYSEFVEAADERNQSHIMNGFVPAIHYLNAQNSHLEWQVGRFKEILAEKSN